ncbi:Lrp/AsnC family transcriptional regulator [Sedimenticola sp.]|uniref:Lrp/AsnC family transcriptional regulator n=1 Tax=Sedimenticola sp. TaxID=1940285 RepID=UPI002584C038|nr:Lrp/AsnC family transcriptional regulator [Sedimenticola sp.]MCW8905320.1 Lrp/AsnC family transcriptional regulator [Sedimenticola sp.]
MIKLDRIDRRILTEMQQNGRISNLELAERVGLSPTPCSRRVKQLEEAGIIAKHVTLLDPARLNLKLTALIQISMDRHTPDRFENFQAKVAELPEVIECSLITGQAADYLVKVVVPDMDAYQEFLLGKITRIAGVSGVQSSFVMQQIIHKTELPLDYLT